MNQREELILEQKVEVYKLINEMVEAGIRGDIVIIRSTGSIWYG